MVTIEFLGPIGKAPISIEAKNLEEVAVELQKDSSLSEWLQNSAIAVNDVMTADLKTVLKAGDRISLLPPVCGG